MNIPLKAKYLAYNGDTDMGKRAQCQYGHGRAGGGNGKRNVPNNVTEDFKAACARDSKAATVGVKTMVVNALTGHRVMRTVE